MKTPWTKAFCMLNIKKEIGIVGTMHFRGSANRLSVKNKRARLFDLNRLRNSYSKSMV